MILEISDRQMEIIEAAGKILTVSGVGGLTIKNLAKEMKFSESAIYRHFKSKEEIIVVLLEYLAENMDERLGRITSQNQNPEEKFISLFEGQFLFFQKNPHFVAAVFSDGLMEESQKINETILKIMGVKTKHLMPILMEGQKQNVFTNAITAEQMMQIAMGTFRLQMFKWKVSNFQFDIQKSGNSIIQSILTLIKTN